MSFCKKEIDRKKDISGHLGAELEDMSTKDMRENPKQTLGAVRGWNKFTELKDFFFNMLRHINSFL
jgi:hypothetical protein